MSSFLPYECLCILCDVKGKFIDCDVMYTICIIRNTLGVQNARESASMRRQFYICIFTGGFFIYLIINIDNYLNFFYRNKTLLLTVSFLFFKFAEIS